MTLGLMSRNTIMKDRPTKYFFLSRNQIEEHYSWDMPTEARAFFPAFLKGGGHSNVKPVRYKYHSAGARRRSIS